MLREPIVKVLAKHCSLKGARRAPPSEAAARVGATLSSFMSRDDVDATLIESAP